MLGRKVRVQGVLHVGLDHEVDVFGGQLLNAPVHGTAGILDIQLDKTLVVAVAGIAAHIVGDLLEFCIRIVDTVFFMLQFGVESADLAGPCGIETALLDNDNLTTQICC